MEFSEHPCKLTEPGSLERVRGPEPDNLFWPAHVNRTGVSREQCLCCGHIVRSLRQNGVFFLGDATGVGKGRTLAALAAAWSSNGGNDVYYVTSTKNLVERAASELRTVSNEASAWIGTYAEFERVRTSGPKTLVIYDEAHVARNHKTIAGRVIRDVSRQDISVVYSTATPASDVRRLGYMCRLGLWGARTKYATHEDFCRVMEGYGAGALELLSLDLKRRGIYQCKMMTSTFHMNILNITLNPGQQRIIDACAAAWNNSQGTARALFFSLLVTNMKIMNIIPIIRKHLELGESVVIALQATGAAARERDDMLLRPSAALEYLCQSAGVTVNTGMPADAMFEIMSAFGPHNVADLSGRQQQIWADEVGVRVTRKPAQRDEVRKFASGDKRVAILTSAGSVGIDLIAPGKCTHYIVETPWSAEGFLQQCGRTNRCNSAIVPRYVLVDANTITEKRVFSVLQQRISNLAALSRADRECQGLEEFSKYAISTSIVRSFAFEVALKQAIEKHKHPTEFLNSLWRIRPSWKREVKERFLTGFLLSDDSGNAVAASSIFCPHVLRWGLCWTPDVHSYFSREDRFRARVLARAQNSFPFCLLPGALFRYILSMGLGYPMRPDSIEVARAVAERRGRHVSSVLEIQKCSAIQLLNALSNCPLRLQTSASESFRFWREVQKEEDEKNGTNRILDARLWASNRGYSGDMEYSCEIDDSDIGLVIRSRFQATHRTAELPCGALLFALRESDNLICAQNAEHGALSVSYPGRLRPWRTISFPCLLNECHNWVPVGATTMWKAKVACYFRARRKTASSWSRVAVLATENALDEWDNSMKVILSGQGTCVTSKEKRPFCGLLMDHF